MPHGADRLKDKVCVVTGAASAIAEAVADRLTSEGATVVGVDRRQHGVGPHSRTADLTDEDQVRELFAGVKNDLGRIDVLYNNAGLNDREDQSVLEMPLPVSTSPTAPALLQASDQPRQRVALDGCACAGVAGGADLRPT